MLPFVTLVTNDDFDQASDLNRSSVYRLNIGISKQTFLSLFGSKQPRPGAGDTPESVDSKYDFSALDQLMPHPIYGNMYWVCVLNPSDATFQEVVQPLIAEAYKMAVVRENKRIARAARSDASLTSH
jgi:hypothetical protein